jgi:hypothetical protein
MAVRQLSDVVDGSSVLYRNSKLEALGSVKDASSVKTSNYTAASKELVYVNVSSAAVTISLPASHNAGEHICIKLVSAASNTCTIDANGSQTIDGSLTLDLTTDYEWAILRSNGSNWFQVG